MPAQVAGDTYGGVSFLLWRPIRVVASFTNPAMKRLYLVDLPRYYKVYSSLAGYLAKIFVEWKFFLGPVLTLPIVALFFTLPQNFRIGLLPSSTKFLLASFAVFLCGSAIETWYNPHYAAPAMALIVALLLSLIRHLRNWSARGLFLSRAIVAICVISFGLRAFASPLHINLPMYYEFAWFESPMPDYGRNAIEDQLLKLPGNQLIIVRYDAKHPAYKEFVYNGADIDASKIVWALELGGEKDQQLANYFKNRRAWLLVADDIPPRLEPYTPFAASESSTISQSSDPHAR